MGRVRATDGEQRKDVATKDSLATAAPDVAAQALQLQRAAGNRAVTAMLQRTPATASATDPRAAKMAEAAIDATVETIARLLKKQVLWAGEEQQIVDIFQRALDGDRKLA